MGDHTTGTASSSEIRKQFIEHLLDDIEAMDEMLRRGLFEEDIIRIGAEQEFCLVNDNWRPSKMGPEVLEAIDDEHFTTELARYNLELNMDPLPVEGSVFSEYEQSLRTYLNRANDAAGKFNNRVVLCGILPTISKNELAMDFMTPSPRYFALNEMMLQQRGGDFELAITGVEELSVRHRSVLFEACNTSFQLHLQIKPDDFISSYNWAQAIAGPVLGISCNSPILLGRELWSETRIALFQQSIDTRASSYALQEQHSRVTFGREWAVGSVSQIFKDDISRYRILLAKEVDQKATDIMRKGEIPKLQALSLHNGTIYRWNRPCYGISNGQPHLRIENRYVPAGPSTLDEMANFVFWVGLMLGRPKEMDDMPSVMDFRDAKSNFVKAARTGKESVMRWCGEQISVRDLLIKHLIPIARKGLEKAKIDNYDIDRFLNIISERAKGETASQWAVANYRKLKVDHNRDDALMMLTKAIYKNQRASIPVHEWPSVDTDMEAHEASNLVAHVMSTALFTVSENDLADLATSVMKWKKIHHLPVEDGSGKLSGLLTWTHMKRHQESGGHTENMLVSDIMEREVITVRPDTEIKKAIALMKKNEIGCVPVIHDRHLVGIITIDDVIEYDTSEN